MNAEIVTSGTELLLGEKVDTNSTYIARVLRDIGVNLYYKTSVGDNIERMALVLRQGLARSGIVITTGGLGPTVDDVTREAVVEATGRPLVLYPECLAEIEAIFARWGRGVRKNNRRQAYLPTGAAPISNPVGTAPGFIIETEQGTVISLPGVPREMEHLMQASVIPYLKKRMGNEQVVIKARTLRTVGLGESWIDERIDALMRMANPTVGLAAHSGVVDIRITARAANQVQADQMIGEMETQVRARLREHDVFGTDDDQLAAVTAQLLAEVGVRLALVESATGGEIARLLQGGPGGETTITSAHVVDGPAALSYLLGIDAAGIEAAGLVSEESAVAAADRVRDTGENGWGLAVLGDLGTQSDVYGDDTGQTFVALATGSRTDVRRYPYGGAGELALRRVSLQAVDMLRRAARDRLGQTNQVDGSGKVDRLT